jgi:lycopene beta-cyclase
LLSQFDYIITGAGCAGLSLLNRMIDHPYFPKKQILVVDQSLKNKNDRTWCYWEREPGCFEDVVHHRWKQVDFYSRSFSRRFDLSPYEYKMIRGIDLYNFVLSKARQKANIHIQPGTVETITNETDKAVVTINGERFTADHVFNSIMFRNASDAAFEYPNYYRLLQHFKGWLIETDADIFDARFATFMDFRVSQKYGTTFVYVLPVSSNKALVEYTVFSENLLQEEEYDNALKQYVAEYLKPAHYTIAEEEFGVIPMTDFPFSKGEGRIINIGTAGGQTKASSGFTFQFIQRNSDTIINALTANKDPQVSQSFLQKRFHVYDSTLLDILQNKKMDGDEIFSVLFKKNPPQRVLKFLDNETNFIEELKIMNSVPVNVFLPAALKALFR